MILIMLPEKEILNFKRLEKSRKVTVINSRRLTKEKYLSLIAAL